MPAKTGTTWPYWDMKKPPRLVAASLGRGVTMAIAIVSLAIPLLGLGLTSERIIFWPALLAILVLARLIDRALLWALYSAAVIAVLVAGLDLVSTLAPAAWQRLIAGSASLSVILILELKGSLWSRLARTVRLPGQPGGWIIAFLLVLLTVRTSYRGVWTNPGLIAVLMILTPPLRFRWPAPMIPLWCLSAMAGLFGWLTFMNMAYYPGVLGEPSPPEVQTDLLNHGDPSGFSGARFFQPGKCPETEGAFYMGEAVRTYRLERDGRETVFLSGNESAYNLIELCRERIVLTGSFDAQLLRFADLRNGAAIEDVPLPARPTTLLLDEEHGQLFVGTAVPAGVLKIDLKSRKIVAHLTRFVDRDPKFSGVPTILREGDHIYGAYSSYFILNDHPGEVFRVNLDLTDYASIATFRGAWGYVVSDPAHPGRSVLFRTYNKAGLYRIDLPAGPAHKVLDASPGYYYLASSDDLGLLVEGHWTTGELRGYCTDPFRPAFHLPVGGMGRGLFFDCDTLFTPVAAGYLRVRFPRDICGRAG